MAWARDDARAGAGAGAATALHDLGEDLLDRVLLRVPPWQALVLRQMSRRLREMVALRAMDMAVEGALALVRRHAPLHTRALESLTLRGPLFFVCEPLRALLAERGRGAFPRLRRLELAGLPATDEVPALLAAASGSLGALEDVVVSADRCRDLPALMGELCAFRTACVTVVRLRAGGAPPAEALAAQRAQPRRRLRELCVSAEEVDPAPGACGACGAAGSAGSALALRELWLHGVESLCVDLPRDGGAECGDALAGALAPAAPTLTRLRVAGAGAPDWAGVLGGLAALTRLEMEAWPTSAEAFCLPGLRSLDLGARVDAPLRELGLAFPGLESLACSSLADVDIGWGGADAVADHGGQSDWEERHRALPGGLRAPPLRRLRLHATNAMRRHEAELVAALLASAAGTLEEVRLAAESFQDPYPHRLLETVGAPGAPGAPAFPRLEALELRGFSLRHGDAWRALDRVLGMPPGLCRLRLAGLQDVPKRRLADLAARWGGERVRVQDDAERW